LAWNGSLAKPDYSTINAYHDYSKVFKELIGELNDQDAQFIL